MFIVRVPRPGCASGRFLKQEPMSRIIKFRGKRVDGKGWAYGDYAHNSRQEPIIQKWVESESHPHGELLYDKVDPETVGQYTGLKDSKGTEIYEGDQVPVTFMGKFGNVTEAKGDVCFHYGSFQVSFIHPNEGKIWTPLHGLIRESARPVIGNIHDTP